MFHDWSKAPSWAKYIAQDLDGSWWWYERKPLSSPLQTVWVAPGWSRYERVKYPNDNFRNTLQKKKAP